MKSRELYLYSLDLFTYINKLFGGEEVDVSEDVCVLRGACCVLRAACCVLRAACCVLRAACCVLRAACCVLRAAL